MELLQLKYFQKVAQSENISKTARELYITPSALSMTISRLEKEIGVKLFTRGGNYITLNEAGRIFYRYACSILGDAEAAVKDVQPPVNQEVNLLTTSPNVWTDLVISFREKKPDVVISQKFIYLDMLSQNVLRNTGDFLLASPLDFETRVAYSSYPLYTDDYPMLMAWKGHPALSLKSTTMAALKNERFIALTSGMSSRKYFDILCEAAGIQPKIIMEVDYAMRERLVKEKCGVAVLTGRSRKNYLSNEVGYVPITDPFIPRQQYIYWDSKKNAGLAAEKFLDFAKNYFVSLDDFNAIK